jgi:hypothetical protein
MQELETFRARLRASVELAVTLTESARQLCHLAGFVVANSQHARETAHRVRAPRYPPTDRLRRTTRPVTDESTDRDRVGDYVR